MSTQRKTPMSFALVTMLILSMAMTFRITSVTARTTYVSVINPDTGDGNFTFNTMNPPPSGGIIVNITVTDVEMLAGWQVNLTWDPELLTIAHTSAEPAAGDVYVPADHIFNGLNPQFPAKNINSAYGFVGWSCAVGPAAPVDHFNGSGRLMCVKFTVIKTPTEPEPLSSCDLVLDRVSLFATTLVDPDANDTAFTEQNGYYEYGWLPPPPVLPYLEISPAVKGVGLPLAGPIVGTPSAFFTVDIIIKNVTIEQDLIGVQYGNITYNNTLLRLHNPADPANDVTEGPFMNEPAWAPYGTTFTFMENIDCPVVGVNEVCVGCTINPNATTGEYDWTERPFGDGLLCTLFFEVIWQDVYPWEGHVYVDMEPSFPGEMFLNSTLGWLEYEDPKDGEVIIYGYIMGRQIDLYVGAECSPYPYPYGGQGPNATADMLQPQKKVCIWANVTYQFWPVQAKVVAFEIIDPLNETLTVLNAITDDKGVANASFRIPWPCDPDLREAYLSGEFTIIASVDIACVIVKDYLWFHFDYLVRWETIVIDPPEVGHCGYVNFTVIFKSKALLPYWLLITIDLKDELQVPIGSCMRWVLVGHRPLTHYTTYKNYTIEFIIPIPKHAFAGIATVHINALTTLPSLCGQVVTPELGQWDLELPTFVILAS